MRNLETLPSPESAPSRSAWVLGTDPLARKAAANLVTLLVLTLAASLVLASSSIWLVPPYWGLMGWLVHEPVRTWVTRIRKSRGACRSPVAAQVVAPKRASGGATTTATATALTVEPTSALLAKAESDGAATAISNEPPEARGQRGRGKGRGRSRPAEVTGLELARWVRVGPGKFVRGDAATEGSLTPEGSFQEPPAGGSADVPAAEPEKPAELPADSQCDPLLGLGPDAEVRVRPEPLDRLATSSESEVAGAAAGMRESESVRERESIEPAVAALACDGTDLPQVDPGSEVRPRSDGGSPTIAPGAPRDETFDGESRTPLEDLSDSPHGFTTSPRRLRRCHVSPGRSPDRDRGRPRRGRMWPGRRSPRRGGSAGPRSRGRGRPSHPQRGPPAARH